MKISKKDLRRIIFENIALEEQSQATARGARKAKTKGEEERGTRTDADVGELLRRVSEETIIRILDPIIKAKDLASYNVQVKLGQKSVVVNQGSGRNVERDLTRKELRAINKEIKKALKADDKENSSIRDIRDQLKVGRRVKLNYKYVSGSEPNVAVASEPDIQAQSGQTPEAPPDDKTYTYEGETGKGDGYEYKVDKDSGCWLARKLPAGKFFSMKKYPKNMKNLDTKFPKARTDEQRAKCPSADKNPSLPKKEKPQSSSSTNNPKQIMDTIFTPAEIKYAPGAGSPKASIYIGKLSDVGDLSDLLEADIAGPLADGIKNNPNYGIYMYYLEDSKEAVMVDTERFKKDGALVYIPIKKGFKPKMHKLGNPSSYSPISDPVAFIEALIDKEKRVSESAFGKSRGTLIREHYWRKY